MNKLLEDNKHISTPEIKQDIADTQYEINTMEREIKGYELIGDKMSHFKANARRSGIKERRDFIEKLEVILKLRAKAEE